MKTNEFPNQSRRSFLRNTAIATGSVVVAPSIILAGKGCTAPSDKINLGFIGTGKLIREELFKRFGKLPDVQITAGCDVDSQKLADFKQRVESFYREEMDMPDFKGIKTYELYEELLANESIDAVVVATPDHWHAIVSVDAMKAGKDVYCEKPLSHRVVEGRAMVDAARQYQRVVQTGSMQRSWENFRHACELVLNGYLGEISKVLVNVGDPGLPCDLPGEEVPDYLNWDRWVGPAQMRGYNPVLAPPVTDTDWPMWRTYLEFGGGGVTDWGAHMFDIAQWGLGMDDSGPVRLTPPEDPAATRGMHYVYGNGVEMAHEDFGRGWAVRFTGSEGSLDISREFLDSRPENIATAQIKDSDKRVQYSDNHYADWISAIRNRTRPVADVAIGHRSATVCNITNIAYRLRRPLQWDPVTEKFLDDAEANAMCTKQYRSPYML
jgi:predicted dehydrogenase